MALPTKTGDEIYLKKLYDDPAFFASEAFGLEPTKQQKDFFDALAKPNARVTVASGHGTGKSTALGCAALWYLLTRMDCKVPCTAPTAHQLQDVLWAEMYGLYNRMTPYMKDQLEFGRDRVTVVGRPNSFAVARTARPENPDALQGFHAPEILFVVDEAAGVHDSVFEVARGALSTPNARIALAANPTQLSGYFYDTHHKNRDGWTRLHFSCLESPIVATNYAEEIAAEYGTDSDMYRVRVLGEFPVAGMQSLIPRSRVEAALARAIDERTARPFPVVLGVDPAYEGTDRSGIVSRQGMVMRVEFVGRGLDGIQLGERVMTVASRYPAGVARVFVDKTGVGASCYDHIKHALPAMGVAFAETPSDTERFADRRAEIWWRLREWVTGEAVIVRGSFDREVLDDFSAPEYFVQPNGKIRLESKKDMRKRGLHSPDIGDAAALTFAHPVPTAAMGAGSSAGLPVWATKSWRDDFFSA